MSREEREKEVANALDAYLDRLTEGRVAFCFGELFLVILDRGFVHEEGSTLTSDGECGAGRGVTGEAAEGKESVRRRREGEKGEQDVHDLPPALVRHNKSPSSAAMEHRNRRDLRQPELRLEFLKDGGAVRVGRVL